MIRDILVCTFLLAQLALLPHPLPAQWEPGYESHGFSGGSASVAVEFEDEVVIGGDFESVGCTWSPGVVLSDFESFSPLGNGLWCDGAADGSNVTALAVWNGSLVAGGCFRGCGSGSSLMNIARWDGSRWVRLGWLWADPSHTRVVLELVELEGDLVAVGNFSRNGFGQPLHGVARWDGTGWREMGVRPQGADALAVFDGELYCGFSRWDGTQWLEFADMTSSGARITAMDVVDQGLAIGGDFWNIDGAPLLGAAIWDGQTVRQFANGSFSHYDPNYDECPCPMGVGGFASLNGKTYMLGEQYWYYDRHGLSELRTIPPNGNLWWAPIEGLRWPSIRQGGTGDLTVVGSRLLVLAGANDGLIDLGHAGALEAIVLHEGEWSSLGTGLGRRAAPRAIATLQGDNWLIQDGVGLLQEVAGDYARRLQVPTLLNLRAHGDRLLVAGGEAVGGHVPYVFGLLAEYGSTGERLWMCEPIHNGPLPPGETDMLRTVIPWGQGYLAEAQVSNSDGFVIDLSQAQTKALLYVDDDCTTALALELDTLVDAMVIHDGQPWIASNGELIRLDGPPGGVLIPTVIASFNQRVRALLSDGRRLVVGGDFHSVNGMVSPHLAIYTDGGWADAPAVDGPVHALARSEDGVVIVGGNFESFGGLHSPHLATLSGDAVGGFPDTPDGTVRSIVTIEDGILIAGDFLRVGGTCASRVAEWVGDLRALPIGDPGEGEPGVGIVLPARLRLHEPSPNPFNPRVTLAFDLPRPGGARLRIYDLAGRLVRTLADREFAAGTHELIWQGEDDAGVTVAAGVYFAQLEGAGRVDRQKLTLLN